jgi:two-component system nitrogen regulation response regulator NtrX
MADKETKILIIDDEAPIRNILSESLKDEGYAVALAHDGESGLQAIRELQPDIVFLDIWMPGKLDGIQVLTMAKSEFPHVEFVMISGHGTIETAVKSTKLGAWDFIEKPLSMDKILIVIANIINYQQQKEEKYLLLNKLRKSIALIGEAAAMVQTKQAIAKVSPTQSGVLIQGEPGSGKHLIAQNIHYMSSRASRPFSEIHCGGVPEDLLDSEIFGIEKGAMPGVDKVKKGKLDLTQGGTLYLAEITEMNAEVQAKLMSYLDSKKFARVGGVEQIESDVRIIVGSSKDLEREVREGRFREDLYHRLNVIPLRIPSLREHVEDVPVLVSYFSDNVAREGGYLKKFISPQAIEKMIAHTWPGNVRELKNFIERIYILTPGEFVDVHDLRFAGLLDVSEDKLADVSGLSTFREARAQFEKDFLLKKINENSGNISKTAEVIGLERSYLHRKIKAYGIDTKEN